MRNAVLALALSNILIAGLLVPVHGSYVIGGPKLKSPQITLHLLPECTNDFQCDATFHVGEEVEFSGTLLDDEGEFLPGATVNIYRNRATDAELLTSAITERDGTFHMSWVTRFMDKKEADSTFQQKLQEVLTIFAKFEGDDTYSAARSGKLVITVKITDLLVNIATDRKLYNADDTALIFVNFIEGEIEGKNIRYYDFVDPDNIRATYDGQTVQLSKKKTGSYTFVTPPLTSEHHQLLVNPAKDGYNNKVGFITVQVSGFFGK